MSYFPFMPFNSINTGVVVNFITSVNTMTTTSTTLTLSKQGLNRTIVIFQGYNADAQFQPVLPAPTVNGVTATVVNAATSNAYDDTASITISAITVLAGVTATLTFSALKARSYAHVYEVYGVQNFATSVIQSVNQINTLSNNGPTPGNTVAPSTPLNSIVVFATMANFGGNVFTGDSTGKLEKFSFAGATGCYFLSGFDLNPTAPTTSYQGQNDGIIMSSSIAT